MSIRLYSRTDAGLRKPRCTTPMYADGRVRGIGRHWPGTTTDHLSDDPEDVARYLQGWQDYHMDGRGWCDIAYQYAVDLSGGVWTLRGFHNRSGAHTPWNEEYYAVLCVVGQFDRPTPSLLEGLAYLRRKALERTPSATDWKGHGQLEGTNTACPGEFIRAITLTDLKGTSMDLQDIKDLAHTDNVFDAPPSASTSDTNKYWTLNSHIRNITDGVRYLIPTTLKQIVELLSVPASPASNASIGERIGAIDSRTAASNTHEAEILAKLDRLATGGIDYDLLADKVADKLATRLQD